MYAKYEVIYRFKKQTQEHREVVLAKSPNEASNEVEKKHDYDINIVSCREDLPSWGDSLIGKLFKGLFRLIFKSK